MYQLILLIPTSVNIKSFDKGWPLFLEAIEQMPGLLKESVSLVDQLLYGQDHFHRIYTFSFPDQKTLEKSLVSSPGEKAGKIIHELTGGRVTLMTAEYQEDSLANIKSFASQKNSS